MQPGQVCNSSSTEIQSAVCSWQKLFHSLYPHSHIHKHTSTQTYKFTRRERETQLQVWLTGTSAKHHTDFSLFLSFFFSHTFQVTDRVYIRFHSPDFSFLLILSFLLAPFAPFTLSIGSTTVTFGWCPSPSLFFFFFLSLWYLVFMQLPFFFSPSYFLLLFFSRFSFCLLQFTSLMSLGCYSPSWEETRGQTDKFDTRMM